MIVSSKGVLGMFAAALAAGGLLSACSSSSKSSGSSSTGTSSSSSSSSGGATCGGAAAACESPSACCSPLTCSGGSCCLPSGETCTGSSQCCAPLTCDPTSNTCLPSSTAPDSGPVTDGGCPLSPAFGGCATAQDCQAPNVCQPAADGGGYCGPPATPSALCIPNGQACSASSGQPCCGGSCVGSVCVPRAACGINGQGCNVAADCCNNFQCVTGASGHSGQPDAGQNGVDAGTPPASDAGAPATDGGPSGSDAGPAFAGTCQPSCGGELASCDTANGNADCCTAQGFSCLPLSNTGTAGVCDYAQYTNSTTGAPVYCGNSCSSFPCGLGLTCQVPTTGPLAGIDPCAAAGLVCDAQGSVCRNPSEQDPCLPGGPACQPLANSTVTDLQCLPYPSKFGGGNYHGCFQPCALADPASGTSDCVDPMTTCVAIGGTGTGAECFPNELQSCPTPFGPCNSSGNGDGVCVPYNFSNGSGAFCFQATLDGGTPGSACDSANNRQNGGYCNPTSFCIGDVCQANCNAGTKGGPTCGQNDAGPAIGCEPIFGQSGDATDFGTCSVDCDFTSTTGGGCPTVGGVPEKCFPPAAYGLADAPTGLCVEAPPASEQVAVGQPCGELGTFVDDCVDGALCLFDIATVSFQCVQLCTNVDQSGGPCKADQACEALFGTSEEGYCGLADGGFGG